MDSISQIVLGAAVGEAVLGKKAGNKAMLYGAIAGTIPDLDVFAEYFTDTVTALEIHRGFSHSILFSLLFAPIFGWLISGIEKKSGVGWKDWSLLMFWGLVTHPVLDSFTTWGTQLFWPLDIRLAFRSIFVIDPLYTLPFLVFLILAMREKRGSRRRRKLNNFGLFISSTYLLATLGLKNLATAQFREALETRETAYLDLQTRPAPFNTILWSANVELEEEFLLGDYSFLDTQPIDFIRIKKNHDLLGSIKQEEKVQTLIKISKGWYALSEDAGNLYFHDLRFGTFDPTAEKPDFVFSYKLVNTEEGFYVEEVERNRDQASELLKILGDRILGN